MFAPSLCSTFHIDRATVLVGLLPQICEGVWYNGQLGWIGIKRTAIYVSCHNIAEVFGVCTSVSLAMYKYIMHASTLKLGLDRPKFEKNWNWVNEFKAQFFYFFSSIFVWALGFSFDPCRSHGYGTQLPPLEAMKVNFMTVLGIPCNDLKDIHLITNYICYLRQLWKG